MRYVMMVVVGIGLVWASTEACFARGPQGGGQGNSMQQMQARHRYGAQYQGTGQGRGQMMGQGPMWPQNADQAIGNMNLGQGNEGTGLQQRKRNGNENAAKVQAQNRAKQQKKTQLRKQDGTGKID